MTAVLRILPFLLCCLLALALPRAVVAQDPFAAASAGLAGDFSDKIEAIEKLAALGDGRAVPILQALNDGALLVRDGDKRLAIERDKTAFDALTNEQLGSSATGFETARVNNRVRGVIRGALGRLQLVSPDRAQRLAAVADVLQSRSADNLPLLEQALAQEPDAEVRVQLQIALAATQLLSDKPEMRSAGIQALAGSSNPAVRAMLVQERAAVGNDPQVAAAIDAAIASIDSRLWISTLIQTIFQGLSLGSVLLLAAMGLAITFGVMGVINMAHGEMVMLGAYATFVVQQVFRAYLPAAAADYSLLVAIPVAFLVTGALGIVLERGLIRFLYGRPLETLLMTWGLSMILQQAVRSAFGPTNREVASPSWMSGALQLSDAITITANRVWIIVFGLIVLAIIVLVTRATTFGLHMRAVTQNRPIASTMGIRTAWVDALTFGLGSGIAGMAGVALSQLDNVSPNLGQCYIIDSFMVVVFGG
ncbi:MAG: urea ABC transporter permease subunit UrtB, partial [Acetobacteraceae bacterium]|nr:urea ABC transporter permease subunit UrtB [Acetobacteraceae bacterium]